MCRSPNTSIHSGTNFHYKVDMTWVLGVMSPFWKLGTSWLNYLFLANVYDMKIFIDTISIPRQ